MYRRTACFFVTSLLITTTLIVVCTVQKDADNGGPLFLTPMIRDGKISQAQAKSRVYLENATTVESYAGYLTVNEAFNSNMFFWFFPAATGARDAPILMWLQGGPGLSSLYSVFNEHGPFTVGKHHWLESRQHSWTSTHSVLYVDNPVGAGYSFTDHNDGYSSNQTAVGQNLYAAIVQFFELFPEYRNNEFYVAGESYAGKYVPAVSHTIHLNNPKARVKINFKGLAIGNGLIDPGNQMVYSEFLYQYGLIDDEGKQLFKELEDLTRNRIEVGDFEEAFTAMGKMMMITPSLYSVETGMVNIYNVMWNENPIPFERGDWHRYVQEPLMRHALHVGQQPWASTETVFERLMYDVPKSVSPWLGELLDAGRYRVLLYSGQMDVIVPYRGTANVAYSLKWKGAENFKKAKRNFWLVPVPDSMFNKSYVAGYVTTSGPLTLLLVRNAGHMVPYDQPAWAHDMIKRFTSDKPFN